MPLPSPWLSYKTQDGKEYYYNPQTKVTTWDRPTEKAASKTPPKHEHAKSSASAAESSSSSTPSLPSAAANGRSGLLAQIQKGTKLKKVTTRESSPLAALDGGGSSGGSGGDNATISSSGAGGGMNAMMAAIKAGGNLRKTSVTSVRRETISSSGAIASSPPAPTGGGGGGFAEIMRKNREAAARKANVSGGGTSVSISGGSVNGSAFRRPNGSTAPLSSSAHSYSAPTTPRHVADDSSSAVEQRLAAIEAKLDKIMAHLGIN